METSNMNMILEILSPKELFFTGEVSSITFPGKNGKFQVLKNHAPLISFLTTGDIIYITNNKEEKLSIKNGIVEVLENKICALIEKD